MQLRLIAVLLFSVVILSARAQEPDALLGYLVAAQGANWSVGGNLGDIQPTGILWPNRNGPARSIGVSFAGYYADHYRSGGMEGSGAAFSRTVGGNAFVAERTPLPWAVRLESESRLNRLNAAFGQTRQDVTAGTDMWIGSISGSAAYRGVDFGGNLRISPGCPLEPTVAVVTHLGRYADVEARWRGQVADIPVDANWRDENAHLNLDSHREGWTGWLNIHPVKRVRAELRLKRFLWIRDDHRKPEPTLEPWGSDQSWHGYAAYTANRWECRFGSRGAQVDLMAYGMQGDYPYAKITQADVDLWTLFASVENRLADTEWYWIAEIERSDWSGCGRGHVEFWPFTSGWADLLGLRRYFIAEAAGEMMRYHVGASKAVSPRWTFGGGINLADLICRVELEHWRPEYLFIGKADEQHHRLSLRRALVGLVSASVAYQSGRWTLSYRAHQLVPIKMWYHSQAVVPSGDSAPGGELNRTYGGALHQLRWDWSL